ncbi:hypothetical protein [Haliangium sp.]|uniref:hypothetical protein n=1 Tax=Haliangium sp. TaxID=2663208 RepID=UPI003D0E2582
MPFALLQNASRWRTFADAVALALGVNMWVSIVALPALFVGTWHSTWQIALAGVPLAVLAAGLWRRSETVLLLAFPAALLLPVAVAPEMASMHVYGLVRFTIVAVGLVAFLLGVSFFTSFYEHPPPASSRPLASSRHPQPVRWRRRFRIYWMLTGLSVVFPATLLYAANFDRDVQAFLGQMYPGRTRQMVTVIDLIIVGVWIGIYGRHFMGVMRLHRTGDVPLVRTIARLRVDAARTRPRPGFFLGVALALGFMAILILSRAF